MIASVLVAVLPALLTTAADMIKMFASGAVVDPALVLAQMQAALTAAQASLDEMTKAHAARIAELAAAQSTVKP